MTGTGTQADPYIVGNEEEFREAVKKINAYVECEENLVFDYENNPDIIPAFRILAANVNANGLVIKNGRFDSSIILLKSNSAVSTSTSRHIISNIHIMNNVFTNTASIIYIDVNRDGWGNVAGECFIQDSTIGPQKANTLFVSRSTADYNRIVQMQRCNLTIDAVGGDNSDAIFRYVTFMDCNIFFYADTVNKFNIFNSHFCYVSGSFALTDNAADCTGITDIIFDLEPKANGEKHQWNFFRIRPNTKSIVYNSDTVNMTGSSPTPEYITALSAADIVDPSKLAAAGIAIDPAG